MPSVRRLRVGLGTLLAIEAVAADSAIAETALEAAFAAIAAVDRCMHPAREGSDLARVNEASPGSPVRVHDSVLELLRFASGLNELTAGVFDPCLPSRPGRMRDIEITPDAVVCHAPVALDFGGFAKGYAVDRAIDVLQAAGCITGVVNAGGDLRVFGPMTDPVFVRGRDGELFQTDVSNAALAVSDTDAPDHPAEHRGYYLREDRAVRISGRVAIVAAEACIADALTKCVLLCDPLSSARVLRTFGARQLDEPAGFQRVRSEPAAQ